MRDASLFGEAEAVRRILLSAQAGVHRRLTDCRWTVKDERDIW
jgi:hypothetical protein